MKHFMAAVELPERKRNKDEGGLHDTHLRTRLTKAEDCAEFKV